MKYIDAHAHLNFRENEPIADFVRYIQNNKLEKIVLIINSRKEMVCLLDGMKQLEPFMSQIEFAVGINKKDDFYKDICELCLKYSKRLHVKVHPRLFEISIDEVSWYIEKIKELQPKTVIIDDFLYGNTVEEDMGLNLVCKIAEEFPEMLVVMAHSGGVNLVRHVMKSKTYKNIYYDISLTTNYLENSSVEQDLVWLLKFMWHRVMLGSDYPDFEIKKAIRSSRKMARKARLSEEQWKCVAYKNAMNIYGGGK